MDNEAFVKAILAEAREQSGKRAKARGAMTIGDLFDALGTFPSGAPIRIDGRHGHYRPASLTSYRGYYERLAIARGDENVATEVVGGGEPTWYRDGTLTGADEVAIKAPPTVSDMVDALQLAVGQEFEGYKGGQFEMGWSTWVHVADWGETGPNVVGVRMDEDDNVLILTAEID